MVVLQKSIGASENRIKVLVRRRCRRDLPRISPVPECPPAYSNYLTISKDVHRFIPDDCPPRRPEAEEPESRIDSPLDKTMVLFHDVVEVFALA